MDSLLPAISDNVSECRKSLHKTNVCGNNEGQKLGFSSFFLFFDCWGSSTYGHFLSA